MKEGTEGKNDQNAIYAFTNLSKKTSTQTQWCTLVMPAFERQRQKNHKFEAGLGYIATSVPYLKEVDWGSLKILSFKIDYFEDT